MAGELDYNRDIKPLQGKYFSQLSAAEQGSMTARYSKEYEELADVQYKRQEREDIKRSRDLTYQMNVEALQKRRQDAAKKLQNDAKLKGVSDILGGIVNAETGLEQRLEDLNRYQLAVPDIAKNPDSAPLFSAAASILKIEQAKNAKADAKTKASQLALRPTVLAGDPEAAKLVAMENGNIDAGEKAQLAAAEARQASQRKTATLGAQQQFTAKKLERRRKSIARTSKILSGVYEVESGDDVMFPSPTDAETKKGVTHSKKHMAALRLEYAKQNNLSPSAVAKLGLTGDELVDNIYERVQADQSALDADEEKLFTESSILGNFNR